MELLNDIGKLADQARPETLAGERAALEASILLLAPLEPHIPQALRGNLGHSEIPLNVAWPQADEAALVRSSIEVVVQVNGKVRDKIQAPVDAPKETMERLALAQPNVQRFVADKAVRKIIVVPNKLVNIVAN